MTTQSVLNEAQTFINSLAQGAGLGAPFPDTGAPANAAPLPGTVSQTPPVQGHAVADLLVVAGAVILWRLSK